MPISDEKFNKRMNRAFYGVAFTILAGGMYNSWASSDKDKMAKNPERYCSMVPVLSDGKECSPRTIRNFLAEAASPVKEGVKREKPVFTYETKPVQLALGNK